MQRIYSVIDGAKSLRLINNCEMIFIDKRLQPVYTVVLDCPGKDSIKLWPLTVVDPWVERRKVTLYLQVGEGGGERGGLKTGRLFERAAGCRYFSLTYHQTILQTIAPFCK